MPTPPMVSPIISWKMFSTFIVCIFEAGSCEPECVNPWETPVFACSGDGPSSFLWAVFSLNSNVTMIVNFPFSGIGCNLSLLIMVLE